MNTEFQNLPNVVSPKEVQTYFGISRSTTYRIFHDATFPAFHIGNRLLVRRDELLGWLEQQKVNKAQTRTRRLLGLMNSFVAVPVVVFVSRKETMHRERYIQKSPAPWA